MLNKEKYKDELEDILAKTLAVSKNGELGQCDKMKCGDCIFFCHGCDEGARDWLNSKYEEHILADKEKAYLSAVIKPFKNQVKTIKKYRPLATELCIITIYVESDYSAIVTLPPFKKSSGMYQGMEDGKCYTLEELGL